jgi:hypothetical protein
MFEVDGGEIYDPAVMALHAYFAQHFAQRFFHHIGLQTSQHLSKERLLGEFCDILQRGCLSGSRERRGRGFCCSLVDAAGVRGCR